MMYRETMDPVPRLQAQQYATEPLNRVCLGGHSTVRYSDLLAPLTTLIERYLPGRTTGTFIQLGGHADRLKLAEQMSKAGWTAIGLGRTDAMTDAVPRVDDYHNDLLRMLPSSTNVIADRRTLYPPPDDGPPHVCPWDARALEQRGIIALCESQHVPDPMLFPIRRALEDHGLLIRTIRASSGETVADLRPEAAYRSGFFIEQAQHEEWKGEHYYTTVYRAVPRVDFGRVLLEVNHGEWRAFDYESFLRAMIKHPEISVTACQEGSATFWRVESNENFSDIMETAQTR